MGVGVVVETNTHTRTHESKHARSTHTHAHENPDVILTLACDCSVLANILGQYPNARGINFDLPSVIASPQQIKHERIQHVAGDFFKSVPEGGDAYIMSHILHDWNDEKV